MKLLRLIGCTAFLQWTWLWYFIFHIFKWSREDWFYHPLIITMIFGQITMIGLSAVSFGNLMMESDK